MRTRIIITSCLALFSSTAATANNFQESSSWQFNSEADRVNQAAVQDMIRKKKSGYYAAPVYVTNIDRQFNCSVSASAVGNSGSNSMTSHSPNQSGASSGATGNANNTSVGGYGSLPPTITGNQGNSGTVSSGVIGDTHSHVGGDSSQALNSSQTNSGSQSANVGGSTACTFGPLN